MTDTLYVDLLIAREQAWANAIEQKDELMRHYGMAMHGSNPTYWQNLAKACRSAAVAFDELVTAIKDLDEHEHVNYQKSLAYLDELTAKLPPELQERLAPIRETLKPLRKWADS